MLKFYKKKYISHQFSINVILNDIISKSFIETILNIKNDTLQYDTH